jgi:peptide-methionine (R)-S-oxide reductase
MEGLRAMKYLVICFALILIAEPNFAQQLKSDKGHENNPYYSTTDKRGVI